MKNAPATLRVRVPAFVREPRGAIAAAAVMVRLLRGIASITGSALASASARVVPAPVSVLND